MQRISDIDDAFAWIESFTNLEKNVKDLKKKYRPDRMFSLLDHFGNPQDDFKIIHIAGSKGKGSTSVLLASALAQKGLKTGLYTSPHVNHYRERIQVNRSVLPDDLYVDMINHIREQLDFELPGYTEPTTFELLTLLAYLLFQKEHCEWCVLETGLGGRLDATNTVHPEAVVLTPIEKEHTQWLGEEILSIAREKAGIIKKEVPVFSSPQRVEVEALFREISLEKNAPFHYLPDSISGIESSVNLDGTGFILNKREGPVLRGQLSMIGHIQPWNAALALELLIFLFPDEELHTWLKGFEKASLLAHMEVLSTEPLILCDGSHTPQSVRMALDTFLDLSARFKHKNLLFACQDDKEVYDIASLLSDSFSSIVITTPGYFKKSHPSAVHKIFASMFDNCILEEDPSRALKLLLGADDPILILGSFFLAGEIKKLYRGIP
ncbi:Mur ligase family protein [Oceanispirochaeta sp.]|jgi:dihydrofolate synthase/folylpolyglutamate synthase|uniref:bifunctional folylpolyglutamate synthase/dihydrofolate synthase n=1 Tax=Oceanispirochaeta sp. TaxID=2035350 RepID=UPI00260C8498|nr:Mur ligase family protein [Oceanispirochaeta sp.]MDA3956516.1 Mur ligase family protein [Oceanispirochaeta sp.]